MESGMTINHRVYNDDVVEVALVSPENDPTITCLAMRWLQPQPYTERNGSKTEVTNHMGGETEWFIVPSTFAAAIGRTLIQQQAAGLVGFSETGMNHLIEWLREREEITDAMCY